jgi:hypothetical protein
MEHTDRPQYADLSPIAKAPALVMLHDELSPVREEILAAYKADPEGWWAPHHFLWGMSVRNLLRQKGFGEDHFGVDNLDDFYIPLVEEALELKSV